MTAIPRSLPWLLLTVYSLSIPFISASGSGDPIPIPHNSQQENPCLSDKLALISSKGQEESEHLHPQVIRDETITCDLRFQYAVFEIPVTFTNCVFEGFVDISDAIIRAEWRFENCTFLDELKAKRTTFNGPFSLEQSNFFMGADFEGASFDDSFNASKVTSFHKKMPFTLRNVSVQGHLDLRSSTFSADLECSHSNAGGHLLAHNLILEGSPASAHFVATKVSGDVEISEGDSVGTINMKGMEIEGDLSVSNSIFRGPSNLDRILVGGKATIHKCTFVDSFSLANATFQFGFDLVNTRFLSTSQPPVLSSMTSPHVATIQNATFAMAPMLNNLSMRNGMRILGVRFNRAAAEVLDLSSSEFGSLEFSNNPDISPPLILNYTKVGTFLKFHNNSIDSVYGYAMEIGTSFTANESILRRDFVFISCRVGHVIRMSGNEFRGGLDLADSHIGADLSIRKSSIHKQILMRGTSVRMIDLTGTTIVDLEKSSFWNLSFTSIVEDSGALVPFSTIKQLINTSPFNLDFLKKIEQFYLREGRPDLQNEAFYYRKGIEADLESDPVRRLWRWAWGTLADYGRSAKRPASLWVGLIAVGTVLFSFSKSVRHLPKRRRVFSALWFSIDWGLPLVSLGIDEPFKMEEKTQRLVCYLIVHRILGTLFVGLLGVALTGLFD